MSFQVCDELDAHIRDVSEGVEGWGHGYLTGALVAFGLIGMAFAIRETFCSVCHECGRVTHNEQSCQCWNDE